MLRRHKPLKRLLDVNLRPEEAQGLMQRVKMHTCSADGRDRLAQVIRVTAEVCDQLVDPSSLPEPPARERASPERQAKRQRQWAKASRRRHRREAAHGLT